MKRLRLAAAITFSMVFCFAAEAAPVATRYDLDTEFFPKIGELKSQAVVSLAGVDSKNIVFYLHGELDVSGVEVDGAPADFTQESVFYGYDYSLVAKKVSVTLEDKPENAELTVAYEGAFNPSRARSPSDYMRITNEGVFLRAYGYSLWFPIFLEAASGSYAANFEHVRLTTPEEFTAVFSGKQLSTRKEDARVISEWTAPSLDLFAAQATARAYDLAEGDGLAIYSLKDKASRKAAKDISGFTKELTEIFTRVFREPTASGDTLQIVQMPRFGDISSGNVVGLSDETWREFDPMDWPARTLAHELVHSYVQVAAERSDPVYVLAREGFPSYFHLPALAEMNGEDYYDAYMDRIENYYLDGRRENAEGGANKLAEIPIMSISDAQLSDYKDGYVLSGRARLFFDYLRRKMGKAAFGALVKDLVNRPHISAEELFAAIETAAPGLADDAHIWLETTDFPDRFRRTHMIK